MADLAMTAQDLSQDQRGVLERNANDLVGLLDQLIAQRMAMVDVAVVEAVSGSTIKVRLIESTTAGAALIPVAGLVPPVGATVALMPTRGGRRIAIPLQGYGVGTGVGQIPTADDVILETQVGTDVQRPLVVQDMNSPVMTNPSIVDFREGFVAENGGVLKTNVRVDWGRNADQVPPGNHGHDAAELLTGILARARLGTGTPNSGTFLRGDGVWATAGGSEGAALADWPRSATESVSSSTFATYTDTSANVAMQSGRTYSVWMFAIYNVLPASSGSIAIQPFIGSSSGGTPSASGANVQALMVMYTNQNFVAPSSSVPFGARIRSNGGTHSLRNGVVGVVAVPK